MIWQEVDGTVAQNVLWCATTSVPTETDLDEIGTDLVTWVNAGYLSVVTDNWTLTDIVLRAMNEEEGLEVDFLDGLPANATSGLAQTPNQVSYTTTLSTGIVGRSARGRIYGLGLPATYVESNKRLTDAGQALLQSSIANMLDILATDGHALQVVSFTDGGVPRAEGRALPVLAMNVRFPLATQRRRLS
jgi:hypothetical protein